MIDLSNQVILTTAAGAGIGFAVTLRLLEGGATVVATDIDATALENLDNKAASLGYADRLSTTPILQHFNTPYFSTQESIMTELALPHTMPTSGTNPVVPPANPH